MAVSYCLDIMKTTLSILAVLTGITSASTLVSFQALTNAGYNNPTTSAITATGFLNVGITDNSLLSLDGYGMTTSVATSGGSSTTSSFTSTGLANTEYTSLSLNAVGWDNVHTVELFYSIGGGSNVSLGNFTTGSPANEGGTFDSYTINFASPLATADTVTWTLQFVDATADGNPDFTYFDNVTLSGVVPEPTSAALLGLGALSLLARRKR